MARTDILFDAAGGDIVLEKGDINDGALSSSWSGNNLVISDMGDEAYVSIKYNNSRTGNMTINGEMATAMIFGKRRTLKPYQLPLVSTNGIFYVVNISGNYQIYSCATSDFQTGEAKRQNTSLLLLCKPGNSYRYPTTGVNIRKFVNGRIMSKKSLADKIIDEFSRDNVSVVSADYNSDTGMITLKTEEK